MPERLFILFQRLLPKKAITLLAGFVAGAQDGPMARALIPWFVKRFSVDMQEAQNPDLKSYRSFNEFFTRPLREGVRTFARGDFISPVDGAISQLGAIENGRIFQAKTHRFTVSELIGGDIGAAGRLKDGAYANLYLSPKDYHRIHMPCDGVLQQMIYIPGALFSVNPATARGIPNLFARNERVVCFFDSEQHGLFVIVLVGATIVGRIQTVWQGIVNSKRIRRIAQWDYEKGEVEIRQGAEMGRFLLGSTVILLFEKSRIAFNPLWAPGRPVRLGEEMGISPRKSGTDWQ